MNKSQWHSRTRAMMTRVAKRLGISTTARKITSNKGGPAVGGEVTMTAPEFGIYVSLACPVNAYGEKDWIGRSYARKASPDDPYGTSMTHPNHSIANADEDSVVRMIETIKKREVTMDYSELVAKVREIIPGAYFSQDNYGQIIIYTELREVCGKIMPYNEEELA